MRKFALLIITSLMVLACQPKSNLTPVNLTIGYIPNIQFVPFYVGQSKGFFAEEGLELNIDYAFGADIATLLVAGKIDVGLGDSDQLILARESNLDLVAFRSYYTHSPLSIVTINPTITKPQDLVGKTIGVTELFGSSFLALHEFLSYYKLTDKVNLLRIGYTQIAMLESGEVDAAVTFVNNENIFLKENHPTITIWPIANFSAEAGAVLLASQAIANQKEDFYRSFNRALNKAFQFIQENPEEALNIAMKTIGSTPEEKDFLRKSLQATMSVYSFDGHLDPALFEATYRQLIDLGFVTATNQNVQNYLINFKDE